MGIFFNKQRSKAAKIIGVAFFALLMFVNIQLTTNPTKSGDIDLFGIKISLITPSAYASGDICDDICDDSNISYCTYIIGHGYCFGKWIHPPK